MTGTPTACAARRPGNAGPDTITDDVQDAILKIPTRAWTPAYDGGREVRPSPRVAELTCMLDRSSGPEGMPLHLLCHRH